MESDAQYEHPDAALAMTIVANQCQRGNQMLQSIKDLRVTFSNIVPDYLLSPCHCAIFISLKFHRLHTDYLLPRIQHLKKYYRVRILLCLVDLEDADIPLQEVTQLAFQNSMSLFLAWSYAEAGRILQLFKQWGDKPPDIIQSRLEQSTSKDRFADVLTAIPSINKVDSATLMREFGTMKKLMIVCSCRL